MPICPTLGHPSEKYIDLVVAQSLLILACMKVLTAVLILTAFSVASLGDEEKPRSNLKFDYGRMDSVRCTAIQNTVTTKLQVLASSSRLSPSAFSVATKLEYYKDVVHPRSGDHCIARFRSALQNFGFLYNDGEDRFGRNRNEQCEKDRQALEAQPNVLGTRKYLDQGFVWHRSCSVTSVSLVQTK